MSASGRAIDFRAAVKGLIAAAEGASAALRRLGEAIRQSRTFGSLEARRRRFGGMTEDLRRWPDQWQSFYCAGLLCATDPDACPSEQYGLGCTCRCHERIA